MILSSILVLLMYLSAGKILSRGRVSSILLTLIILDIIVSLEGVFMPDDNVLWGWGTSDTLVYEDLGDKRWGLLGSNTGTWGMP